jgi:Tfp pilus tip-associated adhesin PilY1
MRLVLALGLAAFCAAPYAAFDPVNDDSDLFRNNPNIPSTRPNVLIILDNTANWSANFVAEKAALVTLVSGDGVANSGNTTGLDSSFNVGLMIMGQVGSCRFTTLSGTPAPDGGYVRFGIRQMTDTNKAILAGIVNSFDNAACAQNGDQGSSATGALAMNEAYLYFAGLRSSSGITQPRRDYGGTEDASHPYSHPTRASVTVGGTTFNPPYSPYPLASATATNYTSAITADCQKNYIIYISNGKVDSGENNAAGELFAGASGLVPNAQPFGPLSPSGFESSWMDEFASYLANTGVTFNGASQKIFTYTVDVAPGTEPADLAYSALLVSTATRGKGHAYTVSGTNVGQELVAALKSIFSEINAVNSVFAASTLPVSVNVRGTNLNQLYIGVFRPDAGDKPRWLGNLKAYQLQLDPTTGLVRSVDANVNPAINDTTGFVRSSALSFWTSGDVPTSTYWSHLDPAAQGDGGVSDSPDGDLVEKGGAAQQVRGLYYAGGVNGSPSRPVYTCTTGALYSGHACVANGLLSETPFIVDNTDIEADDLNITSRTVTSLSAALSKSISQLIDRRPVALDNSGSGTVNLASITTSSTNLSPAATAFDNTRTVNITAMSNGAAQTTVSLSKSGTGASAVTKGVVAGGHGLQDGQIIIMTMPGATGAAFGTTGAAITYVNATDFTYVLGSGNSSSTTGTMTTSLTTTTVTAASHGFNTGDTLTIAGASLTSTFAKSATITKVDDNTFTYSTGVSVAPVSSGATAAGRTRNVVVSASGVGSLLGVGRVVTISGSNPSGYDGTYAITAITSNSFTYQTPSVVATSPTAVGTVSFGGTTATATVSTPPHIFVDTQALTILGASPDGFNGAVNIFNADQVAGTFQYTVVPGLGNATANPALKASTSNIGTVTATLANHGFVTGDRIDIRNVADNDHNVTDVTVTKVDDNTFRYTSPTTTSIVGATSAGPQVRLTREIANNIRAYATVTGHNYGSAGNTFTVTISGTNPNGYDASGATARVEDLNSFSYALTHSAGNTPSTGGAVSTVGSALTNSTTATAQVTAHGFNTNEVVSIAGATVAAFNGQKTIRKISDDVFTYSLGSAQGLAVGSPTITAAGQGERTNLINWIRGENNRGDDGLAASTRPRPSIHGDVLHSRPAVVNYNRRTDTGNVDNDVYIFYGGNDGLFRAVKGGFGSSSGDPAIGTEVWAFAAPEHFGDLRRLRLNSPPISSTFKKPYFFDGPIGVFTRSVSGTKLDVPDNVTPDPTDATQDQVWMYLTMRRGGRFIYALDVSQPLKPRLLWRKGCPSVETDSALKDANGCDLGWGELGQTWSEPKVVSINCVNTSKNCGATDPVLIFGAGYDPLVEDPEPATVNCSTGGTSGAVRTGGTMGDCATGTLVSRTMGRGIFVVNARTGALIFRASGQATPASIPTGATFRQVTDMDYAIPSDMAVVVGDPVANPFRAYVGDTGGQMWRFDFGDTNPSNWSVVKLASIADPTTTTTYTDPVSLTTVTALRGLRKFQFAPDVVGAGSFDMVIAGAGDREHPFDTSVINRVYAFKDKSQTNSPSILNQPTITHATTVTFNGSNAVKALLDVTTQCIEIAGNCTSDTTIHGGPEQVAGVSGAGTSPTASQNAASALNVTDNTGWFIELAAGEKQVGSTLASGGGVVQFGTNQPSLDAGGGTTCAPNLGIARQYQVNFLDGTAFNGTALSTEFGQGGFLPSPVLVYVNLGGETGTGSTAGSGVAVGGGTTGGSSSLTIGAGDSTGGGGTPSAVVCYGAVCSIAPGSVLFSRLRKFWYKEID